MSHFPYILIRQNYKTALDLLNAHKNCNRYDTRNSFMRDVTRWPFKQRLVCFLYHFV